MPKRRRVPKWLIEKRKAGLMPTKKQVAAQLAFLQTLKPKGSKNGDK